MCSPMDTPGSQALEVARNMKDLTIFKKPIGFAKKSSASRVKILDEESYIDKMGEIIQRDFFPHLEKLRAQNEYLEALEQNDAKKMRELYAKYSSGRPVTERLSSPATFETPIRRDESDVEETPECVQEKSDPETLQRTIDVEESKIRLDQYLSSHTSEDNASFQEMMIEAEKKHKLKYAWLYETEENCRAAVQSREAALAIEGDSDLKTKELDSWGYRNKNYIMYIPDGVELTTDEKIEQAKRKQEVVHENTRLKINPFNEQQNKETISELAKSQSKVNDGKIGVDGKEVVRSNTPKINGFSFVATPSPMPGECESPLMTWGQIEGTPFRLDGGDTPLLGSAAQGPSFRMSEPPKREQIALQLAEKAGERHRDRKNKALQVARRSFASPSPRSAMDRLNTMSPAARRLATQKLRIATGTPTPRRTVSSSRTPLLGVKTPNTPRVNAASKHTSESGTSMTCQGPVLTDNLLNLPICQRQRASDFF